MKMTKRTIQLFFVLALMSGALWNFNSCDNKDNDEAKEQSQEYRKGEGYEEIALTEDVLNGKWSCIDALNGEGKSLLDSESYKFVQLYSFIFNSKNSNVTINRSKSDLDDGYKILQGRWTYQIDSNKHTINMKNSKRNFSLNKVKVYQKENKYQLKFDNGVFTTVLSKE